MILNGQTKFRTGRIAGVLLLLTAITVLPLAGAVRADDKSDKKNFNERLRRLEQLVEKLVRSNQKEKVRSEDGYRITWLDHESAKYRYRFPFAWVDAGGRKHEGDMEFTFRDAQTAMSSLKAHLSEKQSEVNKLTAEIVKIQLHIAELSLKQQLRLLQASWLLQNPQEVLILR